MTIVIDVREPTEYASGHMTGAMNLPLAQLDSALPDLAAACKVGTLRFVCKSGMRAEAARDKLLAQFPDLAEMVRAGAGEATATAAGGGKSAPLPLMRQVLIAAGSLVLGFGLAGMLVHPAWIWGAVGVGAGLVFAGATGICGMANLLRRMPWNQRAAGPDSLTSAPQRAVGSNSPTSAPQRAVGSNSPTSAPQRAVGSDSR